VAFIGSSSASGFSLCENGSPTPNEQRRF